MTTTAVFGVEFGNFAALTRWIVLSKTGGQEEGDGAAREVSNWSFQVRFYQRRDSARRASALFLNFTTAHSGALNDPYTIMHCARIALDLHRKCSGDIRFWRDESRSRSSFDRAVSSEALAFAAEAATYVLTRSSIAFS